MATLTQPALPRIDEIPVRIAVLVMGPDDPTAVSVSGPVRNAVRSAFAHPRLAAPLRSLQMDADRLIGRILARWEDPTHAAETHQQWVKSDGSTTVRWWIDRDAAA